jgi:hypothetical protein
MINLTDIYGNVWTEVGQDICIVSWNALVPTTLDVYWTEPDFLSGVNTYDSIILIIYQFTGVPDPNNLAAAGSVSSTVFKRLTNGQSTIDISSLDNTYQYFVSAHFVIPTNNAGQGDAFTGNIPQSNTPPTSPTVGQVYYNPINVSTNMWNGTSWIPASFYDTITGTTPPDPTNTDPAVGPVISGVGQFFYNIKLNQLSIWNGSTWSLVNTDNQGMATTTKIGIGTDGSYDERDTLIKTIKTMLGWPTSCLELTEDAFNVAVSNALAECRRRMDNAYNQDYMMLKLKPGQGIYYLNDPIEGTDKVVDVIKVHRLNNFGLNAMIGTDGNILAQAYLNMFMTNGTLDTVTLMLTGAMTKHLSLMFAGEITYTWKEAQRQLGIYKKISKTEVVCMQVATERTEQELIVDRNTGPWIQLYAKGQAYEILGNIRSQFGTLPGPNGGITLNGADCYARADALYEECLRQIMDMETGNGSGFGFASMVMG